jgi:putative tryptophan/tyrosine transport system substrate-binding protein
MRRRDFIGLFGGAAAAWPLAGRGQQLSNIPRVGFLRQAGPHPKQFDAFREGLRSAGYIEGQDMLIEPRYADGSYERLPGLAEELIRAKVDIIVVDGPAAAKACKEATAAIPIVFTLAVDPVTDGLVASFAHPGGNLTGLTMASGYGLAGKQVELLKDLAGSLSRVAVFSNPGNPPNLPYLHETEQAAVALGLETKVFEVAIPSDLRGVFTAAEDWRANGIITLADGLLFSRREEVVTWALKRKLPGVYPEAEFVEAGGLASYGPSLPDLFRRSANYVDKILKGAKPGDLPIEQPTKFDLVINSKTAAVLELVIPRDLAVSADEMIE